MAGEGKKPKLDDTLQEWKFTEGLFDGPNMAAMREAYDQDGVFIVRNLLDEEELTLLRGACENPDILNKAWDLSDGSGSASRLVIWSHPGNDVTGMVARSKKVAGACEKLLGGEVYHYHTKLMMKMARTGGKHLWHQDYGYWYKNGALRPDMITTFIPIDKCTKQNGCLQVLKGTNRCGRIDHNLEHGQTVADQERIDQLMKNFPLIYAEMEPGDCLFLHCNTLHRSDKNESENRRFAFLVSYNRADNDPVYKHHHPNYTKLHIVENDRIRTCTNKDMSGKEFMDAKSDKTTRAKLVQSGYH